MADKRYRDARTSECVTAEYAAEHPDTTVSEAHNMTMNDINVRVVEESPVPWEELFGYMPEITDGLPVADYLEGIRGEERPRGELPPGRVGEEDE